jgi:hypothetical protein
VTCLGPLIEAQLNVAVTAVWSASDFVLVCILSGTSHGVCASAIGDEGTTVDGTFVEAGSGESQEADVRGP